MTKPADELASHLHAIADPARRRILQVLKEANAKTRGAALSASDIEQTLKLSQPTISHHMAVLEKSGLVEVKKDGHWRRYRRHEKALALFLRGLKKQI